MQDKEKHEAFCAALVEAWKVDGLLHAISSDLWPGALPSIRVRPYVAAHNVLANNALWDNQPQLAFSLLKKHGLRDKRAKYTPNRDKNSAKAALESYLHRSNNELHARRAWGVCK